MKKTFKITTIGMLTLLFGVGIYFLPQLQAYAFQTTGNQPNNETRVEKTVDTEAVRPRVVTVAEAVKTVDTAPVKTAEAKNSAGSMKLEGSSLGAFKATAYCLRGITASGSGVRRGIVAADPRVLPLGSRIQISAGAYSGTYTVADTGGVIKGRILDIWVPSCSEAIRFGRRTIGVSLISKGGKGKTKKAAKK
jgi:3D (Asp-Asp-Asp) domain-containing protein